MAAAALAQADFCVYEHWRPDKGTCFYVGKGKLKRAKSFEHRNDRHGKIILKLKRAGLKPELRIVISGLSDRSALAAEVEQIKLRRAEGCDLANYTNGGDGPSGYRFTPAQRAKISASATGRVLSPETIAKMVAARTGSRRSAETRARQSASAKVAQKTRFEKLKSSKEGREALRKNVLAMSRKAANDPAIRALRSSNALALWQDPGYRAKMALRRRWP